MWMRRSKISAPLTDLVGECGQTKATKAKGTMKAPWHWDEIHQQAFDLVKTTIARDVVLAYPDNSESLRYTIYTDASNSQIGSVITQKNRPLAFFSRKLSDTQKRYNTTEKELLAIVETLKSSKVCCGAKASWSIQTTRISYTMLSRCHLTECIAGDCC
jgi:hypothetical protein